MWEDITAWLAAAAAVSNYRWPFFLIAIVIAFWLLLEVAFARGWFGWGKAS